MSEASPHTFAWASIRCSATNSAPSRFRYSVSSEASNLHSSHGMDQYSHRAQAVRVNDDLMRTFCYPVFHPMVRVACTCSTALRHKSSAITNASRLRFGI